MDNLKFSLDYYLIEKRWFHFYEIVRIDDNEYILKLVVRPNFSLKCLTELMFRLGNYNFDTNLYWEQLSYKKLHLLKVRIWKDNPDDTWF